MKKIIFTAVFAAALLTGCQSGRPLDYAQVQSIQRGVSTEADVRQLFGEPSSVYTNAAVGTRTLIYRNTKSDEVKRPVLGLLGSIAGGVIGYQIGDGAGQAVATMIGSTAGGALGANAVTTREQTKTLQIDISLATGRVTNVQFTENSAKQSPWYPSSAPAPL